jgi:hypothetical protein
MAIDLEDKSTNSNTLTNSGAAEYTADTPFAASTMAVDLDTVDDDYLYAADSASLSVTGDFTAEAWVKRSSDSSGEYPNILSKYDTGLNKRSFSFRIDVSDHLQLLISDDGTSAGGHYAFITSTTTVKVADGWTHVGVSYDASAGSGQFYKDGSPIESGSGLPNSIDDNATQATIGCYLNSGSPGFTFDGVIDEVRLWNDIRSDAEISNNYNRELTGKEAGLVAYWPFDSIVSAILKDSICAGSGMIPFTR